MVYETDFYTVRRPYSRPTITSYSVTAPRITVTTWKVKPSIRTSVLIGELDRIYHRSRPHLAYVPTEDFLNSRPLVDFDDETKIIRAETERLMKRIYTSVPHPRNTTPLQILPYYGQHYTDKYSSPRHRNTVPEDILNMSYYNEPSARTIGRGHLACVSFAGGRGYPRRKHLYSDENRDIHDEIKFRSYYNKNRVYEEAMSLPTGFASYLLRLQPDNRNGTLTSSEKLHITNILKERKEKKNSADRHQIILPETMNENLEKNISGYKSKSVDETIIPVEREAKLNKSKPKDSNPVEKNNKEINGSMEYSLVTKTLIKTISEESQTHQNMPEKLPEQTSDVLPLEKIVTIDMESKAPKEKFELSSNSSSKAAKTKTQTEEKELKIVNEPEIKIEEKQKEMAEAKIEDTEKTKEELPNTILPHLLDTVEQVKQEITVDENTDKVIQSSITELSTKECKEESIITEDVPTTIEEDSNCLNVTQNKYENSVVNDIKLETTENTEELITEGGKDEEASNRTENNFETQDENTEKNISADVSESFAETIQQTVTETQQITIIESSQVMFSSEQQETIVKNNEIEYNNTRKESINEQVIPEAQDDSSKSGLNLPSEQTNIEVQEKILNITDEVSEKWESNNTLKQEDHVSKLNEECSTDQNELLKEKIIDIEIERSDEPTEAQNMIEEVTDLASPDIQRELEAEPLIEEPQSPEADLIYNKSATNEVCELLSDVPEEF